MIGPGSETTLDEFVYSGPTELPSAQKMQVSLTRGVFRFTTGTLDKKAYLISTPVASIAVQGTVLDIDIGGGLTRVTLVEGRALVCPRRPGVTFEQQQRACAKAPGGRQAPGCDCVELNDPGQTAEVTTAGGSTRASLSSTPVDFAPVCARRLALRGPALRFGCSRGCLSARSAMRPLGSSANGWRAPASLAGLVFVCALGGSAPAAACSPAPCYDLDGEDTTFSSLSGSTTYTNSAAGTSPTLTNVGPSSTFLGVIVDGGPTATIGLTQESVVGGVLFLEGHSTYSGPTTVQAGTLMGGTTNAFSAKSPTTVNPGGTLDLGGLRADRQLAFGPRWRRLSPIWRGHKQFRIRGDDHPHQPGRVVDFLRCHPGRSDREDWPHSELAWPYADPGGSQHLFRADDRPGRHA